MPRPKPAEEKKCRTLRLTDAEYEFMRLKGVPGLRRVLEAERLKKYNTRKRDEAVLEALQDGTPQRKIQTDLHVSGRVIRNVVNTMWQPLQRG